MDITHYFLSSIDIIHRKTSNYPIPVILLSLKEEIKVFSYFLILIVFDEFFIKLSKI
jgi:hypothetical protein